MTLHIFELQESKKAIHEAYHQPSVHAVSWMISDPILVSQCRAASTRKQYEQVVSDAVNSRQRHEKHFKMIPPSGVSPWKEWVYRQPHRLPVRVAGDLWEIAPVDDLTLALLRWG